MKLLATFRHAIDNSEPLKKEVKSISVWINHSPDHKVSELSIRELLQKARETGKMHIYDSDNDKLDGKIDAFDGTPLYTNGQCTVISLFLDGKEIYNQKQGVLI